MGAFSAEFVARKLALRGAFEAHLTVETARGEAFAALCRELGVDHVAIELASGAHHAQPMTASHHRGELPAVIAEVEALHARIEQAGFPIVRTKLEATVDTAGVPTQGGYFEFHVKVRTADPTHLAALAEAHGGRLSRNERSAGQRFVTLRSYSDRATAEARLEALLAALAGFEHTVVREYTVYDSRVQLDAGWLEPP